MKNTTTPTLEGHAITAYLGVVTGEVILGANIVKDFLATVRDVIGGRSGAYEKALSDAREMALAEMNQKAQKLGANAVVGIDIDYETIGKGGSMLMVAILGTAVIIE